MIATRARENRNLLVALDIGTSKIVTLVAEVSPDAAGPLVDRLKQLGKVARFEVQRRQTTPEGTTQPVPASARKSGSR